MAAANVPHYSEMLLPTLQAVAELGGSASIGEIVETVIKREEFSSAQQAVLHNKGPETEIGYRLAWARSALKHASLLTNSTRGVWALTDEGTAMVTDRSVTGEKRRELIHEKWSDYLRKSRKDRRSDDESAPAPEEPPAELSWKSNYSNSS